MRENLQLFLAGAKQGLGRLLHHPALSHPLAATIVGFLLTGVFATLFGFLLTLYSHGKDTSRDTRNSAIGAEAEISELTSERRERAALVASSIRRNASDEELTRRKKDYDEAYVRWNSHIPGDILRFRAGFDLPKNSEFERLVDGLTNFNILLKSEYSNYSDGLLKRVDDCITAAYDLYIKGDHDSAQHMLKNDKCNQAELYGRTVNCFAVVAETMYQAIEVGTLHVGRKTMDAARAACAPPT